MKSLRNKFMSCSVSATLGLALLAGAALKPARSEAAVFGFVAGQYAVVADVVRGALAISAGLGTIDAGGSIVDNKKPTLDNPLAQMTLLWLIVGIALDDSGNQKIYLKPISDKLAAMAQISQPEQESFAHELDVIQPLFDDISAQVAHAPKAERAALARGLWDQYRTAFAPEAFTALQKALAYQGTQKD